VENHTSSTINSQQGRDPDLAHLRLLHLADSALPIGALAHSFGLESLAACGLLAPAGVPEFLRGYVEEVGVMEAVFCREAFRLAGVNEYAGDRWVEINQRLSALKPARESRAGSAALGQHFLSAVVGLGEFPLVSQALAASRDTKTAVHHGPAFGLVARLHGTAMLHDYLLYDGQSEAGAIGLGGVEGHKDLGQVAGWDAGPVV